MAVSLSRGVFVSKSSAEYQYFKKRFVDIRTHRMSQKCSIVFQIRKKKGKTNLAIFHSNKKKSKIIDRTWLSV